MSLHKTSLLLLLSIAACSSPSATDSSIDAATIDSGIDADAAMRCPEVPNTSAGLQLQWLVNSVNNDLTIAADDYVVHTTQSFRNNNGLPAFQQALDTLSATGTFQFRGLANQAQQDIVAGVYSTSQEAAWAIAIMTIGDKIDAMEVREVSEASLRNELEQFGSASTSTMLIAEVINDACVPIFAHGNQRLAIASVFKLYVLGAVAQAIENQRTSWDTMVPILPSLQSTGTTAQENVPLSVQELAKRMIKNSDNTATDHLLEHVGRLAVENMLSAMGHELPSANIPFLSAREVFILKFVQPKLGNNYCATNDLTTRRTILEQSASVAMNLSALPTDAQPGLPKHISCLEWFASPTELCSALAWLANKADAPGLNQLRTVLIPNAEALTQTDSQTWSYVAFKPGSEPGVSAQAWYLERCDGRSFVATGAFNNSEQLLTDDFDVIGTSVLLMLIK